jgi:hypothetical protein
VTDRIADDLQRGQRYIKAATFADGPTEPLFAEQNSVPGPIEAVLVDISMRNIDLVAKVGEDMLTVAREQDAIRNELLAACEAAEHALRIGDSAMGAVAMTLLTTAIAKAKGGTQ